MANDFIISLDNIKPFVKGTGPIIVVDDDQLQIQLVETFYKKSKRENELICLLSGKALLEYCTKVLINETKMPEVILLDINMPQLDGFEVLKEIRGMKDFKQTPIIIMFTCSDSDRDKEMAKSLNANAYYSKPNSGSDYINFFKAI